MDPEAPPVRGRMAGAILRLGAIGCLLVAGWLVAVLFVVRPVGIAHEREFWIAVMASFAAWGIAALALVAHPRATVLRWTLALTLPLAMAFAAVMIASQFLRDADEGHFEGSIVLMGIAMFVQACALGAFLWATRRRRGGEISAPARA